jgi:hypothetical protein
MKKESAMKHKTSGPGADKTPMGECPLCYTANPYSISHCCECNLPLPWAKAETHEREPCGQCLKCQSENPYTSLNCWSCGARLPWANAVSPASQQLAAKGSQLAVMASPSANGHTAPVMPIAMQRPALSVMDEPNQFVDAVSLLCPPLGFVAYVTLLGQLPRQALNAARFALYGLGVWAIVLGYFFVVPNLSLRKKSSLVKTAPVATVANSETAGEIYN